MLILLTFSVLLWLHLEPSWGSPTHPYYTDSYPCVITQDDKSPYVTALYDGEEAIKGCVSQETTPSKQNVYVVNIVKGAINSGNQVTQQVVDLYISPVLSTGKHDKPLIFVLNSRAPVQWRLHTQRISNTTRNLFWLPTHSKIIHNGDIKTKVKKFSLPSETDDLLTWVRTQPRAAGIITSFAEVSEATEIHIKVGLDNRAPMHCEIVHELVTDTMLVKHLYVQPSSGCFNKGNEGTEGIDVHIIEVHNWSGEKEENQGSGAHVKVDVTKDSRRIPSKHIVLVLKAHRPVEWVVTTKGIRGKLVIVTDNDNDDMVNSNGVAMQPVSVVQESLVDVEGQRLINWSKQRYGPPVSYTSVDLGNVFQLVVDGAANLPDPPKQPDPSLDENGNPVNPFSHPEKTQVGILQTKAVDCQEDSMVISLRKMNLIGYGVKMHQLTLLDPRCTAFENDTHFILRTNLAECGTVIKRNNGIVFYQNKIVLRSQSVVRTAFLPVNDDSSIEDDIGSGSGLMMSDDTHMDDEDYNSYLPSSDVSPKDRPSSSDSIRVEVECEYSSGDQPKRPTLPPALGEVSFHLNLYHDDRFRHEIHEFPMKVEQDERLYVGASIDGDSRLGVMVYSCWISENLVSYYIQEKINDNPVQLVLDKGCQKSKSLNFQIPQGAPQDDNEGDHFDFKYQFYHPNHRKETYLQCQLEPCLNNIQEKIQGAELPQCVKYNDYCMKNKLNTGSKEERFRQTVHVGTFFAAKKTTDGIKNTSDYTSPSSQKECTEIVPIQGLDSGTVVGIAFAAFLIGVFLTAALWYIHTHTGKGQRNFHATRTTRSTETSGESTPSSTAPITIHQVHHH